MRLEKSEAVARHGSAGTPGTDGHREGRVQLGLSIAVGTVFALLVMTPLIGRGYLVLLDWIPGPDVDLPRSIYGLDGGLTTSILLHVGNNALGRTVGGEAASWLPFFVYFPLAFVAMSRLVPGGRVARTAAGALYALNPFVVDRLWAGHIAVMLGYALLPFFLSSVLRAADATGFARLKPALWIAVLTGITPHYLWICGLLYSVALVTRRPKPRDIGWAAFNLVVVVATSLYILSSSGAESRGFAVGQADLEAYETRATLQGGIYTSVALLQGFWRLDRYFPTMPQPMTFIVFASIIAVMIVGLHRLARDQRRLVTITGVSAVIAYFLALGTSGPTGWLFTWAFDHVPGFAVMREPQKFVAVVALFYALCFGTGAARLVALLQLRFVESLATITCLVLPLAVSANALFAFQGQLETTDYPESYEAAEAVMGEGDGAVLWLPWHQYASQQFTGGRIVAEPAGAYFEREVIVGDNVELPNLRTSSQSPRSVYIEGLLERGQQIRSFGQLVAPLGVEFVALAKATDYRSYDWLERSTDLEQVLDSPEVTLMRNTRFQGVGHPVERSRSFTDLDQLIEVSNSSDLSGTAFTSETVTGTDQGTVERRSNTEFGIDSPSSARFVIGETFDTGWSGVSDTPTLSGTLLTNELQGDGAITYSPWRNLQLLYSLSVTTFVVVFVAANFARTRRKGPLRASLDA